MKRTSILDKNKTRKIAGMTLILFTASVVAESMVFAPLYVHAEEIDNYNDFEIDYEDEIVSTYHYDYDEVIESEEQAEEEITYSEEQAEEQANLEVISSEAPFEEANVGTSSEAFEDNEYEECDEYGEYDSYDHDYLYESNYNEDNEECYEPYYNDEADTITTYFYYPDEPEDNLSTEETIDVASTYDYAGAAEKKRRENEKEFWSDPIANTMKLDEYGNVSKNLDRQIVGDILADSFDAAFVPVTIAETVYNVANSMLNQIQSGHFSLVTTAKVAVQSVIPFGRCVKKLFKWK